MITPDYASLVPARRTVDIGPDYVVSREEIA